MDPTDKELREQLADGPFPGGGFDERLRRRIESNLDRPSRRSRPRSFWAVGSAAAVLIVAMVLGIWQWSDSGAGKEQWLANRLNEPSSASQMSPSELAKKEEPLETAMLIGLRKDVDTPDGGTVSTYRTLLVAPEGEEKLEVAAEGEGIVMPYNQSFWLLDSTADDGSSSMQNITAYEAYSSKKLLAVPEPAPLREGLSSERLLYVGHEYVAVAQEASPEAVGSASGAGGSEFRFVKSVKQLSESMGIPFDPATEPHTTLEQVLNQDNETEALRTGNEQWSIVRQAGAWIGAVYRGSSEFGALNTVTEEESSLELPESVARDNSLAIDWNDIRSLEPSARDAYTSSNRQVLAVVLDREIKVYPYGRGNAAAGALDIELEPGESVVMVQWSVEQKYTEQWITKVNEIFQAASSLK